MAGGGGDGDVGDRDGNDNCDDDDEGDDEEHGDGVDDDGDDDDGGDDGCGGVAPLFSVRAVTCSGIENQRNDSCLAGDRPLRQEAAYPAQ